MRLHDVYLLVHNDGEEYEIYDSEEDAKDRLIELARQSEDISEMREQLIRSQGFFEEDSLNHVEIVYVS